MEITKELIDKAKACKSADELLVLAKENEIEMIKEEAEALLGEFREGELADEELDNVAGGAEGCKPPNTHEKIYWPTEESAQYLFNVGDQVEALGWGCKHHTATCTVRNRKIVPFYVITPMDHERLVGYLDQYYLEKNPGVKTAFKNDWYERDRIEK